MKNLFSFLPLFVLTINIYSSLDDLNDAIQHFNIREIEQFIKRHDIDYNQKDSQGRLPLVLATERGLGYIVRELLKKKADPKEKDGLGASAYSQSILCKDEYIYALFEIRKEAYKLKTKKRKLLKSKTLKLPPTTEDQEYEPFFFSDTHPLIQENEAIHEPFYYETSCTICQEDITKDITTTQCHHSFHSRCIAQWKRESRLCPLCRNNLPITSKHLELYKVQKQLDELNERSGILHEIEQRQRSLDIPNYLM